jgi:hypothetical protein
VNFVAIPEYNEMYGYLSTMMLYASRALKFEYESDNLC